MPVRGRIGRSTYRPITFAGTDCLKLYQAADDEQARLRGRLLREPETARYELKGMETLSVSVPTRKGHDDYLMSRAGYPCAGVAYAAATTPPPPVSQVIPSRRSTGPHGDDWARVWYARSSSRAAATPSDGRYAVDTTHLTAALVRASVPLIALVAVSTGCAWFVLDDADVAAYGLIDTVVATLYVLRRRYRLC